jgi:Leucine Rich Repeat (LRR) protein/parallel beta helix pectate lyase-like protein
MRRRLALVTLAIVTLAGTVSGEEPVYFACDILKAAVEEALWASDPTPTDMLQLTSLSAGSAGIQSITGLEYAANLESLRLPCNKIGSISALSGLSNLRKVVMNNNQIGNISALSSLSYLEHLDMHDNHLISNLGPLSGLTELYTLILRGNDISNVGPLSGLTGLSTLKLENNSISNISALAGLTGLSTLDLRENPLGADAYSTYIPQILANNPGIWFTYPASPSQFVISSTAGGSVVTPGEGEFSLTDTSHILLEAEADPCFVFVGFSGTFSSTQNPVQLPVDQDHQIHANFVSVLDTLYVDDDAPNDRRPGDIAVSDLLENGTPAHPFDSIQEAIEVAAEGTSVIVRPGTYDENISLMGRSIHVTGIDPNDPNVNDYPVIQGRDAGPVVSFSRGEDPNCLLSGFVLSGGQGRLAGAVLCLDSSPTIANCLVVGNSASDADGAAIYCKNSDAVFTNCTVADNRGGERGGGFHVVDSNTVLVNSIIWSNAPDEMVVSGAGELLVSYSSVLGGWPGRGNLDADPLFVQPGSWADPEDPDAFWMAGDYHLRSREGRWDAETQNWIVDEVTSPCIDAGDPLDSVENEAGSNGGAINMGAYGGTAGASW